jgi:chloramphenicol-sensitive protein RarD
VTEKQRGRGFAFGLSAYLIWGSFPLIIASLHFASAFEIVVWRIVFGFLASVLLISVTRGWQQMLAVLKNPKMLGWVAVSSVFIAVNWVAYVIGVQSGHVAETSLGYFINPLVTVVLAVVFLGEKLSRLQWVALAFGFVAVVILTINLGSLPIIALTLAVSFGIYGFAKSKLGGQVSGLNSFALESGVLLPVALVVLWVIALTPEGVKFASNGVGGSLDLMFFGVMTAIPLIFFGIAAKHLPLSVIGFMQYLTPCIQFVMALTLFGETLTPVRWVGFSLVWAGLVVLSIDMLRRRGGQKA